MTGLAETTEIHTRILRLALGIEEARAYWAHVDPAAPAGSRALQAFEQRWFGAKTSVSSPFFSTGSYDRPTCDGFFEYIPSTGLISKWTVQGGRWTMRPYEKVVWTSPSSFTFEKYE